MTKFQSGKGLKLATLSLLAILTAKLQTTEYSHHICQTRCDQHPILPTNQVICIIIYDDIFINPYMSPQAI